MKGFTLVEVFFSIAAIGIIAGISIPVYQSFQVRNDLDIAAVEIVQILRRAQTLSQAVDGDSAWGVYVAPGLMTLFKGAGYAVRDSSFDEGIEIPASVTPSGVQEIVFERFTGLPQTIGTITLASYANESRDIVINAKGMVSY